MPVRGTVQLVIDLVESLALDLGSAQAPQKLNLVLPFDSGSGDNQLANLFSDTRTLAASGTENLDLAGALLSALNSSLTFNPVKIIAISARKTNTNNVEVGPAASNGFLGPFKDATDRIVIKPGGLFLAVAPKVGWPVTPSTGDLITVTNSAAGTSVTYDVVIAG